MAKSKAKKQKKQKIKAEEAGFFRRWLSQGHAQVQLLLGSALVALVFTPEPFRSVLLIASIVVLIIMIISWARDTRAGMAAVSVFAGSVLVAMLWVFVLVPALNMEPAIQADILPGDRAEQVEEKPGDGAATDGFRSAKQPTSTPASTSD